MTQPRKRATVRRGSSGAALQVSTVRCASCRVTACLAGTVAASIPMPNPEPPASRQQRREARSPGDQRASVNSGRQSHSRRKTASTSRATGGRRRAANELLARRLECRAVAHARRAHRLAAAAAEAGVEVLDQRGVVGGDLAALERAHEHDAAARAVGFVAGGEVGGAGGEAEAAVHAGVERGVVGRRTRSLGARGHSPAPVAHSPRPPAPPAGTVPGSKVSRSRPTSWPTPSR